MCLKWYMCWLGWTPPAPPKMKPEVLITSLPLQLMHRRAFTVFSHCLEDTPKQFNNFSIETSLFKCKWRAELSLQCWMNINRNAFTGFHFQAFLLLFHRGDVSSWSLKGSSLYILLLFVKVAHLSICHFKNWLIRNTFFIEKCLAADMYITLASESHSICVQHQH